ncbi:DUF4124 domain-containing protein [Oxalicibacterium flavum]|uniref:DUF4124 domain-containing protein n=1 Tax=Oxalicibacterium flavum TaxID=179467 RepID=UPI001E3F8E21|nr:DUF4124 domain-containing protein [Oxalicibacterium flavum]
MVLWLLYPMAAHAGIIACKDAAGRTLTSDRPIPECADRTVREYGRNGVFRREIAAPPTAEQQRVLDQQRRQRQAEEDARRERQRADHALMSRYRSEDDIEVARQRESASLGNLVVQHKGALLVARQEWEAADGDAAAQERAAVRMRAIGRSLQDAEDDLVRLNGKYDSILQRYRELAGRQLSVQSAK